MHTRIIFFVVIQRTGDIGCTCDIGATSRLGKENRLGARRTVDLGVISTFSDYRLGAPRGCGLVTVLASKLKLRLT